MIAEITDILNSTPPFDGRLFIAMCALFVACVTSAGTGMWKPLIQTPFEQGIRLLLTPFLTRLNRPGRGQTALRIRGCITFVLWLLLLVLVVVPLHALFLIFNLNNVFQFIVIIFLLSPLSSVFWLRKMQRLKRGKEQSEGVYYPLSMAAGVNLVGVDEEGINRIAVGEVMHSLSTRLGLPLLTYIAFGLYPAMAVTGLALIIRMARGGGHGRAFTLIMRLCVAPFYAIANLVLIIPVLLAALLTPQTHMTGISRLPYGWNLLGSDHFTAYLSAHLMGVVLGGPVANHHGERVGEDWLGPKDGTARLGVHELARAGYFYAMAVIMLLVCLFVALSWNPQVATEYIPSVQPLPDPVLVPDPEMMRESDVLPPVAPTAPAE